MDLQWGGGNNDEGRATPGKVEGTTATVGGVRVRL
jgi:hypothetical protein